MSYTNFSLDIDGDGIALVTWNSPGRTMNVIDAAVTEELSAIVEEIAADGAVKGAVLSLLIDAYQRRDKVGLISFRGTGAELLLPPTSSADAAARRLETMRTGGRTPLAAGLIEAYATLRREKLRDPLRRPLLVVVTDGRHNAGGEPGAAAGLLRRDGVAAVVVDCESGPVRLGLAGGLANALGADCVDVAGLSLGGLADSVRAYREVA